MDLKNLNCRFSFCWTSEMEAVKDLELGDFDTEMIEEQQGPHPTICRENIDLTTTVPISSSASPLSEPSAQGKLLNREGNRRSEHGFVGLENQLVSILLLPKNTQN